MTKSRAGARVYTVVEVVRGMATAVHTFRRLKDARVCKEQLCEGRDLQEDDVQLFDARIDHYGRKN